MTTLGRAWLVVVLGFLYLPIAVLVAMAFNESPLYALPFTVSLHWFAALAADTPILTATRNSLLIAAATCVLATTAGTLAAVALDRGSFRGRAVLRAMLLPPIAIPWLITGTAMLVFFFWSGIGRGLHSMVIGHVGLAIPYVVLVVGPGLQALPANLEDAAKSLGATPVRAFFSVTLPLLLPSIIAAALFAFAVSFDQFVISYFLATPDVTTLPVQIYGAIRSGFTPEINAISTLMLGASLLLLLGFVRLAGLGGFVGRN
jgi:spermidine/putrescine transport system permease protein